MVQLGMESLAPLGDQLRADAAREEALAVIRPEHPKYPKTHVLRAGRFQFGMHVYFEASIGCINPNGWSYARDMTNSEYEAFMAIPREAWEYCAGPSGAVLHFHVSEL